VGGDNEEEEEEQQEEQDDDRIGVETEKRQADQGVEFRRPPAGDD
jgi:hypothetical protein